MTIVGRIFTLFMARLTGAARWREARVDSTLEPKSSRPRISSARRGASSPPGRPSIICRSSVVALAPSAGEMFWLAVSGRGALTTVSGIAPVSCAMAAALVRIRAASQRRGMTVSKRGPFVITSHHD
jgi:hypothetical protein